MRDDLFKIKDKRIKVFNRRLVNTQKLFALFAFLLICHLFCIQILDVKHYRAKAKRQRTSRSFIMRGELAKVSLSSTEALSRHHSSDFIVQDYIRSLSLDLLDDEYVQMANITKEQLKINNISKVKIDINKMYTIKISNDVDVYLIYGKLIDTNSKKMFNGFMKIY